ncbi:SNF7 protein, putative [Bodo saltans]|uniref:SNF7 protein, putative n=1 Tax=Bodo saltans TaxID=75058 RepID=A0A0S4JI05_BODSA|nr:SNF7 protein, putative [Bodo saltans]|eukprot:CUG90002.1 SNF7 protein, putative [Bodo saltans]
MLKRFFGGSSSSSSSSSKPAPSAGNGGGGGVSNGQVNGGIERLEGTIELLEKREAVLEKKCEQELLKAKAFMEKKNKTGALQCMKRKKMYEEQLNNIAAQKVNMETMKFAIQNTAMNQSVLETQRRAAQDLMKMNKTMNVDQVEEDMDQLREAMDQAKTVSEALVQPLDDQGLDEDELMMELENELQGLEELDDAPKAKVTTKQEALPAMPAIPSKPLPKQQTVVDEDEEALRQLEMELNS